jgi:hypothetical protein
LRQDLVIAVVGGDDDGAVNLGYGAKCDVATAIIVFAGALPRRKTLPVEMHCLRRITKGLGNVP